MKRQATKVIMKVQKNKYNGLGAEFNTESKSDEPQFAEVKQYALDGENNAIITDGGEDNIKDKSPRPSGKNDKKQQQPQQTLGADIARQHNPQASYAAPSNSSKPPQQPLSTSASQGNNGDEDGDDEEEEDGKDNKKDKENANDINFDEDANDDNNNHNNRAGGEDEGEVYLPANNRVPPPPNMGNNANGSGQPPPPPPNPYAEEQPYFPEPVEARPVPQRPKPVLPTRGVNFLDAIKTGVQLKQAQPVKREAPQDSRSQLLTSISKGKALNHVEQADIPKPKEEVANASIYAVLQRRKFIEDSESDDSDGSDWGSEED